jgi:uncharacterized membrane protein HdeD (DUF308 family)
MFGKKSSLTKEAWWMILIAGIASAIFGFIAIIWPALTLTTIVYIFAIFVVVTGAFGLFSAFSNIKREPLWWLMLIFAILNMAIGVYLIKNPLVTAALFVILLAVFIFAQAIFDLVIASYAGKGDNKWVWVVAGILGFIAGFVVMFYPISSSVAFVWVLGLYALIRGIAAIAFSISIRDEVKKITKK